jgi:hypothetical protein
MFFLLNIWENDRNYTKWRGYLDAHLWTNVQGAAAASIADLDKRVTQSSWLNCGDLTLGFTSDAIILVIYVILAMHVIVIYFCQS